MLGAALAVVSGLLVLVPASSSATTREPLAVTAAASPRSGGTVHPGSTVTYTLTARSLQPLPTAATVVDDLSGLLGNASIASGASELAKNGLALDAAHRTLTWTVQVPGAKPRSVDRPAD
jgi:hypothetical protein